MAKFLVDGGAGYIGSHMMKQLVLEGSQAVAFDNLSTGHADAVVYGDLLRGDLANRSMIQSVLREGQFDGVFHFASSIEVSESVANPRKYYSNNVINTLNLIHVMMDEGIDNLIFSSTAAVYGTPKAIPITEQSEIRPVNAYGRTKAIIESILMDYRLAYGFRSTSLRYFNAAGADMDGEMGERHEPESHLIPIAIEVALGLRREIHIFGTGHGTEDGTCVRDFIHVSDLCSAHSLAMSRLRSGDKGSSYNLGNGCGFSVREIISTVQSVSGINFPIVEAAARDGDPAHLVADSTLAKEELCWSPRVSEIEKIVESAWKFKLNRSSN